MTAGFPAREIALSLLATAAVVGLIGACYFNWRNLCSPPCDLQCLGMNPQRPSYCGKENFTCQCFACDSDADCGPNGGAGYQCMKSRSGPSAKVCVSADLEVDL